MLDYTSDEKVLGKPIGGDLREGKVTLPIILLQQRTGPEVAALIQQVVTDRQVTPDAWQSIKTLLATHGATEAAYQRALEYGTRARNELLQAFPAGVERDGLVSLVDYVLQRDR